ncbi:threonine/homoserine/homoserine lactone efflux protein [Pontibacter aydingkolensis]|uniref:LysE family transporter n=1 Tax=Pontibacter aydingkolensis TaxID=1911536 RepID=A0ABS7CZG4_9BACT|nr:LysE family transporter [Pontibacter aydingkolensis]MBW7469219.1 LysE family transporter [Pontibacter aydingkolensis]
MVKAFVFGLTIAIAVGPIAILIINRGLNTGWRSGVMSGIGAALADFTYGIVAFTAGTFLAGFLDMNQQLFVYITSLALFLFGAWMLKGSIKAVQTDRLNPGDTKKTNYLLSTYLLTIINPLTVILFLGFSGQLVSPATGLLNIIALATAIFTGSLIIQLAFASFGATLGRFVSNPSIVRLLNIASSVLIMGFGVAGIM